ncbi:MAG: heavy metal translocating P-type ATPase [Planctomycetota bacterium]|jgi:Cu+-exporting ATPase
MTAEAPPSAERRVLQVSGMRCAACAASIEDAVAAVPGVSEAVVNFATEQLAVGWDGDAAPDDAAVIEAVRVAGYGAASLDPAALAQAAGPTTNRWEWLRLVICVALAVDVLLLDYSGYADQGGWLAWVAMGETWLVIALAAGPFVRGAWAAARRFTSNMDTLVALAVLIAASYGSAIVLTRELGMAGAVPGMPGHFLHAAALLIAFVRVGKFLEERARRRATQALRALLDLTPDTAWVKRDGEYVRVESATIVADDVVRVRPGESVPVDGVIVTGAGAVDESMLTGESVPVEHAPGDTIYGGTIARTGSLEVRATGVGGDTAVAKLTRLVEEAQASRAPIQRFADRVSGVFVPAIVLLAALTGFGWWFAGAQASVGLLRAVAVLVIACPCALGLATPVSVLVGSALGLRHGILVKSAEALESVGRLRTIAFDKTGTLTAGTPEVQQIATAEGIAERDALGMAGAAAGSSNHPLSAAIHAKARSAGNRTLAAAQGLKERSGLGITAEVGGREVVLGNARHLQREAPNGAEQLASMAQALEGQALTPVLLAVDGKPWAVFGLADAARPEAAGVVAALRSLGVSSRILSGDRNPVVDAVGEAVGIGAGERRGELRPEEKLELIKGWSSAAGQGPVAMVGDGINDAPALAASDVGIAIGSGTDVAKESGDLVLVRHDLRDVVRAVRLGRVTLRNIRQNLFWALFYNCAMVPAAMAGMIPPGWAGAAMAASSISVVLNALRLRRATLD